MVPDPLTLLTPNAGEVPIDVLDRPLIISIYLYPEGEDMGESSMMLLKRPWSLYAVSNPGQDDTQVSD